MGAADREAGQKHWRPKLVVLAWAAVSTLALTGGAVAASPIPSAAAPHVKRAEAPNAKRAEPPKPNRAMRVFIVADGRPGCEPSCGAWISAQGEITADTPAQFRRVFRVLGQRKLPIFISSPGGSVPAALTIGREIRKRGFDVAVERTIFQKCEQGPSPCDFRAITDNDKGRPEPVGAYCASACVLVLAAGTERVVPVYGYVGVHQHHATQTMRKVLQTYRVQRKIENWRVVESRKVISEKVLSTTTTEMDPNYAPVRAYFTEMGINTAAIMPLLLSAPHHTIHRMTPDERRTTRIVTRSMAGDVLLPSMPRPTEAKSNAAEPAARPTAVKLDTVGPAKPEAIAPAPRVTEAMPDMAEAAARPTEVNLSSAEPAAPKAAAAEAAPASSPAAEAAAKVVADLMLLYPPGGDTVDIFIRVRPLDQSAPAAHYTAYLGFAHGSKLTARSTGDGAADPLYAALGSQDFCRLHRTGNLSIKVALESDARPGRPLQMASDMSKAPGALEFAAKNCGG